MINCRRRLGEETNLLNTRRSHLTAPTFLASAMSAQMLRIYISCVWKWGSWVLLLVGWVGGGLRGLILYVGYINSHSCLQDSHSSQFFPAFKQWTLKKLNLTLVSVNWLNNWIVAVSNKEWVRNSFSIVLQFYRN